MVKHLPWPWLGAAGGTCLGEGDFPWAHRILAGWHCHQHLSFHPQARGAWDASLGSGRRNQTDVFVLNSCFGWGLITRCQVLTGTQAPCSIRSKQIRAEQNVNTAGGQRCCSSWCRNWRKIVFPSVLCRDNVWDVEISREGCHTVTRS